VFAAYRIGSRALRNGVLWAIAAAAFVAIFALHLPFPLIVLTAGIIGAIGGKFAPDKFKTGGGHGEAKSSFGPAVIDDDTPPPRHALFSWAKLATYLAIGLAMWGVTLAALAANYGWESTLTQIGWFFTKAAMLTFGGAYAVLPYVYQGGVEQYGWLTATQMIDGLALGETTPGPLIMVVAFVGFVGGWTRAVVPESLFLSGVLAASIVTFFTFLPSFLFILAGGPLIESTHGDLAFTAPLIGVTAAVVGVIVNLAMFFGYHVLWPAGFGGTFEVRAAAIGIAAAIALFRFKVGIIPVIGAAGAAGFVLTRF
jgi:chromate transporter